MGLFFTDFIVFMPRVCFFEKMCFNFLNKSIYLYLFINNKKLKTNKIRNIFFYSKTFYILKQITTPN